MISRQEYPDEFDDLIEELDTAKKFIECLINEMQSNDFEGERYYKSQITNIYACVNRAWNMRNKTFLSPLTPSSFKNDTSFPTDIP